MAKVGEIIEQLRRMYGDDEVIAVDITEREDILPLIHETDVALTDQDIDCIINAFEKERNYAWEDIARRVVCEYIEEKERDES